MPDRVHPQCIKDAFELYLKYNGERFDLIEKEMHLKGWTSFDKQNLSNRGKTKRTFREGWIERYGWKAGLEIDRAIRVKSTASHAEILYNEIETIRQQIFEQIKSSGVNNRDLIYQHEKYSQRSAELLEQIEKARSPLRDFAAFFKFLLTASVEISPILARELVNAEDSIIKRARDEFETQTK